MQGPPTIPPKAPRVCGSTHRSLDIELADTVLGDHDAGELRVRPCSVRALRTTSVRAAILGHSVGFATVGEDDDAPKQAFTEVDIKGSRTHTICECQARPHLRA
jgi:hypothetical protein